MVSKEKVKARIKKALQKVVFEGSKLDAMQDRQEIITMLEKVSNYLETIATIDL